MKHVKHLLLLAGLLLCSITASAHEFEVDGIYYNTTSNVFSVVEVTFQGDSYDSFSNEYTGALTIPATVTYDGVSYSVTGIREWAFAGCSNLTSVTIPEGMWAISSYAFFGCSNLTSVTIPESVEWIGGEAFSGCSSLTSVTLPENVTNIGGSAFSYSGLTSITIPEGVTSIGSYTFYNCSSLTSIVIPESVTSIGESAFDGCSSLTSINIPASVTSIEEGAFQNCSRLTSVTIPEGVKSIGNYAFSGCSSLTGITIPVGVTSIEDETFSHCDNLTSITIPEGVTSIGSYAFYDCSSLTSITLPESVTSIESYAFEDCSSLTSITIPEGVTSIQYGAFLGCINLKTVINYSDLNIRKGSGDGGHVACYADIVVNADKLIGDYAFKTKDGVHYLTGYIGDDTELILPTDYQGENYQIGERAFDGCSSLTSITIPEGVTSIGTEAFYGCSSLTAITIPEGVKSIGNYAFSGCSSLTGITIPVGVTSIEDWTFSHCDNLTSITIPEGVTSIGSYAFYDCSSLTSITLPESVTSIGSAAFYNCESLTSITLPESVTSIGSTAFYNCESLTSITLPESVTNIGESAFSYSGLTSITIPEGVTSIGEGAFSGCSSLTSIIVAKGNAIYDSRNECNAIIETASNTLIQGCSITIIPESVTSIGNYAFSGCSSLTSITIPEGVTSIGSYAFYGCSNLTSITIPASVTSIGYHIFYNCTGLTSITCYAATPPSCEYDTFEGIYKQIPVYVPATSISKYWYASEWKEFTNYQPFVVLTGITLSQTVVSLIVGDVLALTAEVAPDNAHNTMLTWSSSDPSVASVDITGKVVAVAPGTATITATANDGSGVSASCELTVRTAPAEQCAAPIISYVDGKVSFTCTTEGAKVFTTVTEENDNAFEVLEFDYIPTHTFTAYATKEDYANSDEVTLTICWVPCTEKHAGNDDNDSGILAIPSRPVLIQSSHGVITLTGLAEGTKVRVCDLAGVEVAHDVATGGKVTLSTNLAVGSTVIVYVGEQRSVKVIVR